MQASYSHIIIASCRKVLQIFINEIWFNGIAPIPMVGNYCVGLRFIKTVMFLHEAGRCGKIA